MQQIVVFGTGKIADVVYAEYLQQPGTRVVAFTCHREYINASTFHGLPVVPFEQVHETYPPDQYEMFIAVGYQDLNRARAVIYEQVKAKGYRLPSCISANAQVYPFSRMGENCLIMNDATLQPFAEIGDQVFVWSNTVVAHHAKVGSHSWLASDSLIGGSAMIGDECFLGLNATVGHEVSIGARSFIGAGALVLKSAPAKSVFIAKETERFRLDSDAFLRISKIK